MMGCHTTDDCRYLSSCLSTNDHFRVNTLTPSWRRRFRTSGIWPPWSCRLVEGIRSYLGQYWLLANWVIFKGRTTRNISQCWFFLPIYNQKGCQQRYWYQGKSTLLRDCALRRLHRGSFTWDWGFILHDDVIKWEHFPRYWSFVRGIHRWPVNSPLKGQWRGALVFFFDLHLNKRSSKQSGGWWFETLSRSLWRHCNASGKKLLLRNYTMKQ